MQENTTQEYEKAIKYIYDLMQNGSLQVGSKLPAERIIAQELGIGRNSTREAISILSGMGLVDRIQGSGNYISKNAGQSIRQTIIMMLALGSISKKDICEFRRTMEKSVCSLIIEKNVPKDRMDNLNKLLIKMQNLKGKRLSDTDREFHNELIILTENNLLIIIMEAITEVYREWIDYVIKRADNDVREELVECHKEIYMNIMQKECDGTFRAIDRHYDIIEKMIE